MIFRETAPGKIEGNLDSFSSRSLRFEIKRRMSYEMSKQKVGK